MVNHLVKDKMITFIFQELIWLISKFLETKIIVYFLSALKNYGYVQLHNGIIFHTTLLYSLNKYNLNNRQEILTTKIRHTLYNVLNTILNQKSPVNRHPNVQAI